VQLLSTVQYYLITSLATFSQHLVQTAVWLLLIKGRCEV